MEYTQELASNGTEKLKVELVDATVGMGAQRIRCWADSGMLIGRQGSPE